MVPPSNFYESTYGHFSTDVREEIRREVYGRDIGQNSWLTADELERFARLAGWSRETTLLEIGCGSGGPALFLARTIGLAVTGVDISEPGIAAASAQAKAAGLGERTRFLRLDGSGRLPFDDGGFDAVLSVDAINHLPDRAGILAEWHRVLRPGGLVVYTDPVIVTGAVSNAEIAERSAIGYFLFVPPGENQRFLREAGFELLRTEDVTENEAAISARRMAARESRRERLREIEDAETFEATQRFLRVVHALASRRGLSRFMFLARKT
jgi:SAM-dependent methyltransferase